ncbi:Uu.00g107240.m01.CDS01 [Anthostomella pinea]|uniref:Uu.00g107240.m01.CDS01 n=1 Tax=Anthostomella pinea TaxID=933095 RepID=A0AAI8YG38_9PEZI|nr:Uu.00g107240.m01.CDS01 [Anthostomella pinea]
MGFLKAAVALPLLLLAGTAALPSDQAAPLEPQLSQSSTIYDAVIVGGGPAGLSALSGLARVRRNVLLIDSGEYRNNPTRHMHDVLGYDGVTPAYYRWAAREQLSHYETVSAINGTVTKVDVEQDNTFTVLATHPSGEESTVCARKIVLATGLRDILPGTPGIEENWGKGIYWCPWCDGNEHADQALGLFSDLGDAPDLVREVTTLNSDVIAFVNGTDTAEARAATEESFPQWEKYLALHNVTVDNRTISALTRLANGAASPSDPSLPTAPEYDLFRLDFTEGDPVERAAFFVSWPDEQKSDVGEAMGVQLYGGRLAADGSKGLVTNIPGVYAVGDANADNVTNVSHALYTGKRTAVYLHVQLAREEITGELAATNGTSLTERDYELDPRTVWETMNGGPKNILFAGDFDQ